MNENIDFLTNNNVIVDKIFPTDVLESFEKFLDDTRKFMPLEETNNNESMRFEQPSVLLNKELGRIRINLAPDLEIIKFFNDYIKQYSPSLYLGPAFFVEYNKKYGTPFLPPHLDQTSSFITFNYQLKSNITWRSMVEGKEVELLDGQGFWINVKDQVHWRRPHDFKEDDFLQMVFFHFLDYKNLKNTPNVKTSEIKSKVWLDKELKNGYKYYN
jgi:hypothetical protein